MTRTCDADRKRFYQLRDARTVEYLNRTWVESAAISIKAGDDACLTRAGQLLLIALVNQLMRFHRDVHVSVSSPDAPIVVPPLCSGVNLGDEMLKLANRIDPYGNFRVDARPPQDSIVSIGVGETCGKGLNWYLGFDRCVAELATDPVSLGDGTSSDLRGASVAAVLGASAAMKVVLGMTTVPRKLSAWNLEEGNAASQGPLELPAVDVGRTLIVGAGAVANGVVYWLNQWGHEGSWTIVDADCVELHNTNRCVLFFPDDAGWRREGARLKSSCLAQYLSGARHVDKWYDQANEAREDFDTVLVLANERNVRTRMSHRNDPLQFQATTSRNWLAQLHRHIAATDGCVRCRMSDIQMAHLTCGEGATTTADAPQRPDAALPFLSLASGLMLASELQRLQLGEFGASSENRWDWDFKSTHQMTDSGIRLCRDDCTIILPARARRKIASTTQWYGQPWLA